MKNAMLPMLGLLLALCATAGAAKKPNILFIVADDQSPFDFKAYNPSSPLDAPVIGKLAAEHAPGEVCG